MHFFELEVAVPSKRHEDVGTAKKENCKDSSFHSLVDGRKLEVGSFLQCHPGA